ncbi:hypothetical protein ACJIZ3_019119 [Penstemon smallii]|uniref:TMEM205-like domain-containing protein n=1 Tax=Penstemon smallii TaxID=265156 RepID=A0ABD3T1T0_9LAMI
MMNVLALGLLFTSVVTAGFFSPNPQNENSKPNDVIVKEGHRAVVVEYEKDDEKTKVLISPQDHHNSDEKGYVTNAKEKVEEISSSLLPDEEISSSFNPRELVCDAYGKCKHKIANVIGKSKETVAEKAHEASEKVYGMEEEAIDRVKDTAADTAHKAYDKAKEMKESLSRAKDKVTEKADETKQGAKQKVHDVMDTATKVKEDAYEKMEGVKEKRKEAGEIVKEKAKKVKKEGEKGLSRVFGYLVDPVAGVLHLMGFAAAYGMCVWVTFASSYVLASVLPRQQFAMVQSKIYPVYFKAMASSVGMALLGHLMGLRNLFSPLISLNLLASLAMILVNMMYLEPRATKVMFERMKKEKEEGRGKESHSTDESNRRVVESVTENVGRSAGGGTTATATAAARIGSQEKPEEAVAVEEKSSSSSSQINRLSEILRRLNSYSSLLNVATLMSLTWHLVYLGKRLHTVC